MIEKPMLAAKCEDINKLMFPVMCTPKLDGIRCLKIGGKALSRKLLPIPNVYIREQLERHFIDGCDGELIVPGTTFNQTSSAVMSIKGTPEFVFHVFDYANDDLTIPYYHRMNLLERLTISSDPTILKRVLPVLIVNIEQLEAYESQCLAEGYEGVMIRSIDGPYKQGRSTEKEGFLLKLKRFEDGEAEILGFVEKMRNDNAKVEDNLGHSKRSKHQENMVPMNTLGAILVRDIVTGIEFSIGSGLDDKTRDEVWKDRDRFKSEIVKYKHQPSGKKELPRFPTFIGFRNRIDM